MHHHRGPWITQRQCVCVGERDDSNQAPLATPSAAILGTSNLMNLRDNTLFSSASPQNNMEITHRQPQARIGMSTACHDAQSLLHIAMRLLLCLLLLPSATAATRHSTRRCHCLLVEALQGFAASLTRYVYLPDWNRFCRQDTTPGCQEGSKMGIFAPARTDRNPLDPTNKEPQLSKNTSDPNGLDHGSRRKRRLPDYITGIPAHSGEISVRWGAKAPRTGR